MSQEQKFVSLSADELDRDIDDLIGLAGHLSEIQHWAAQAGSKHLAKLAKKLLDAKFAAAPTQEQQADDDDALTIAYMAGVHAGKRSKPAQADLDTCPKCGGPADNGHDRCIPPTPYYCTKCTEQAEQPPEVN